MHVAIRRDPPETPIPWFKVKCSKCGRGGRWVSETDCLRAAAAPVLASPRAQEAAATVPRGTETRPWRGRPPTRPAVRCVRYLLGRALKLPPFSSAIRDTPPHCATLPGPTFPMIAFCMGRPAIARRLQEFKSAAGRPQSTLSTGGALLLSHGGPVVSFIVQHCLRLLCNCRFAVVPFPVSDIWNASIDLSGLDE